RDAAEAFAARLVPELLRIRPQVAGEGACADRSAQGGNAGVGQAPTGAAGAAPTLTVVADAAEARRPLHAPPHLAAPPRTAAGLKPARGYIRCTASGAKRPIAMKARPTSPRPPASQASASMPVMTVAEARTMAIWNAADATS